MDDDTSRKRELPGADDPSAAAAVSPSLSKRPKFAQVDHQKEDKNDDEEDDILAWLTLDEDTMSQLLDLLDPSPTSAAAPSTLSAAPATPAPTEACSGDTTTMASFCRVGFVDYPYNARLEVIRSSSSFVTINVNEESCGSSFSEIESSMMASIDRGGAWVAPGAAAAGVEEKGVWCSESGLSSGGAEGLSAELECGVGGGDGDDDLLALLLGEGGGRGF